MIKLTIQQGEITSSVVGPIQIKTSEAMSAMSKLVQLTNKVNNPKRKLIALLIGLILFTKIGTVNILYILQYADCIIKLIIFKKRIKYASSTAIYSTRVHLYDIGIYIHPSNIH